MAWIPDSNKPSGFRLSNAGFPLDFQAKASYDWELKDGHIIYDLEGKNYNDLVQREPAAATLILILLCLPKADETWHQIEEGATTLRNCCYWHVFSGEPVRSDSKKRIKIPVNQRLTPEVLKDLVEKERARRRAQFA